jgi:predicted dehydrogenase
MVHDLDLLLHWVDSPVVEVRACGLSVKSDGLDVVEAWLETENGCTATLCASRLSHKRERMVRMVGPEDYWSIDLATGEAHVVNWQSGNLTPVILDPGTGDAIERFHEAFLAAVRGEGPFPCPAVDGARVVDLLARIRRVVERR